MTLTPQANATHYLTSEKAERTAYHLLVDEKMPVQDVILETKIKNLDIIPADQNLSAAQIMLANTVGMQFKLRRKLAYLDGYDYVFIDTPPSPGLLTINAVTAADKILIPVQVQYFAMEGVADLLKTIDAVKEDLNQELKIAGIVLTMYDRRIKLSSEVSRLVRAAFKDQVFKTVIPVNVKLAEAPSHHKPIADYCSWSSGAKAYERLAKEFING